MHTDLEKQILANFYNPPYDSESHEMNEIVQALLLHLRETHPGLEVTVDEYDSYHRFVLSHGSIAAFDVLLHHDAALEVQWFRPPWTRVLRTTLDDPRSITDLDNVLNNPGGLDHGKEGHTAAENLPPVH